MARKPEFNSQDLNTWINNIKNEAAENALLKKSSKSFRSKVPTGQASLLPTWEARLGKTTIPADQKSTIREGFSIPEARPRQMEDLFSAGRTAKGGNKKVEYTIDNRMEYRDVAKDLNPS